MNSTDRAPSQTSDCSSVVDLSCTYNISPSNLLQEPSPRSWAEDLCFTLTSASSLTPENNTVSRRNSCDNEELQLEDGKSQIMPHSSDALMVTQQNASTLNASHKLETKEDHNDVQIQAQLDAFYKQSSWRGNNDPLYPQLSEKISDLSKKQHLYALRSFQLGKIVLSQKGEKVLQSSSSNNLFVQEETKNLEPIPGLSKDVVRFVMDRKKAPPMTDLLN